LPYYLFEKSGPCVKQKHHTDRGKILKSIVDQTFSVEQCNELFAAILVHDDIDLTAELPETIHLEYSQLQLTQCYRICFQLWQKGVDRKFLSRVAQKLYWHRSLEPEDEATFKHMRAKFKHLRFAYMTFDIHHCYPPEFHRIIRKMGNLQDAFKHEQLADMNRAAIYVRLLSINFVYAFSTRKIKHFEPTTTEAFRDYINNELHFIRRNLLEENVTGRVFHDMRKVISRQVALYDNLKTLYPSPYHMTISRYLSTLNGLMGGLHDELIAKNFDDTQDYESHTFKIPAEIRQRLIALTTKYKHPLQE
jgi:hypothetical protein